METRSFGLTDVRFIKAATRAADTQDQTPEGDTLRGYASVFNSASEDLGGFVEFIAPGAFKRSLDAVGSGDHSVVALWNHNDDFPLGSTSGGKLTLSEDERGLAFSLDTSRFTPAQLDAARDGDLKMSFGFIVRGDSWVELPDGSFQRTITDLDLREISPVTWPAYKATEAAMRSLEAWKSERSKSVIEASDAILVDDVKAMIEEANAQAVEASRKIIGLDVSRADDTDALVPVEVEPEITARHKWIDYRLSRHTN